MFVHHRSTLCDSIAIRITHKREAVVLMKILAVDDEVLALADLRNCIEQALPGCDVRGFHSGAEALSSVSADPVDVAFLDIELCDMSGLELAKRLKDLCPQANIVFVTGYPSYAVDAFHLHASGYVLKPADAAAIKAELDNLRSRPQPPPEPRMRVQCFGNFEVFVDGKPLAFARKKTKELFAYLISRRGASCTNREIAAVLWEDRPDSLTLQSNLRNLVSDLFAVLRGLDAEDAVDKGWGALSARTDKFSCDYFDFFRGDTNAINSYHGEFMAQYSWAEFSIGMMLSP